MIRTPPLTPEQFENAKVNFLRFAFKLMGAIAVAGLIWSHFHAV